MLCALIGLKSAWCCGRRWTGCGGPSATPRSSGRWFGVRFDGPFVAGSSVTAAIAPTTVDDEVAKRQEPHERGEEHVADRRGGAAAAIRLPLAPFAIDPGLDYDRSRPRCVEFTLAETPDGVLLTVVESGFDAIPEARRDASFDANSEGWTIQTDMVRRYLTQ